MFASQDFLPPSVLARLTETRVHDPDLSVRVAKERVRRERLAPAGRLTLLVADHAACRITNVGDRALALADRGDYLARILRALISNAIDGLITTMDILEDLLCIDGFLRQKRSPSILDGKLLIASLNRGGFSGASWEINDAITGPTPAACMYWYFDGVKLHLRIAEEDAGCVRTMLECNHAITQANSLRLSTMVEVLPVTRCGAGWQSIQTPEALAQMAGIASALGDSSRYLWLNLPHCEQYEIVARATTLPLLVVAEESVGHEQVFLQRLAASLSAGTNVRGALVGRNILYPGNEDPWAAATAVGRIVHGNWTIDRALQASFQDQLPHMDRITRYL